jgi:hypothetical protein
LKHKIEVPEGTKPVRQRAYKVGPKQKAINAHAEIDSAHWDMLKDDLKTLGLYDNVKNYGDAMNMFKACKL